MKILKSYLYIFWIFLATPSLTLATTYVVDSSGAGDFTTIQDAVYQAASVENTGASLGYAYFTRGSDSVSIWNGISNLQPGMLISVDERNWYEIAEIIGPQAVRITRTFDENNRFNSYKAVNIAAINIKSGIYRESVNMQGLHFARVQGLGNTRESVIIQPLEVQDPMSQSTVGFYNIETFGHIHFKKLTVRNITTGGILSATNQDSGATSGPSDTNLTLENVHLDAQCCDVIYSPYGHVSILKSRLEGENDVLGGYFKSLTVKGSDIMSHRNLAIFNAGKAVFVKLLYNSLIEDSLILTKAHDPANPSTGNGNALRIDTTNGATLTIRRSVIFNDGGASSIALQLGNETNDPPSNVLVEDSRLLARSSGTSSDIKMRTIDSANLKCTEYVTVTGGGSPTILPCP